ncbi:hypothetical protein ACKS23_07278 [Histoplasma ohiense]
MDGQYIIIVLENPLAFALNFFLLRHQLPRNQGKKKKKKPLLHIRKRILRRSLPIPFDP